jgi:P27 family predicted phage terminase small subunit
MPTKVVAADTMTVGGKGTGKHWTQAEVDARKRAAEELLRAEPVDLRPPEWLGVKELAVWYWAIDQAKGVKLFDNLDAETLALYCNATVEYQRCAQKKRKTVDAVKEQQAWARILSGLSDKLGFNPSARARLIKKRVDEKRDDFGEEFDK